MKYKFMMMLTSGALLISQGALAQGKQAFAKPGHSSKVKTAGDEIENGDGSRSALLRKPIMVHEFEVADNLRKETSNNVKNKINQDIKDIETSKRKVGAKVPAGLKCLNDNIDQITQAALYWSDWQDLPGDRNSSSLSPAEFRRVIEKISTGFKHSATYVE